MLRIIRRSAGSLVRNLRRDQRGIAIIEMALVAPILALVVVGMVDVSNGYSKKLQLEQAAQRTIERAQQTVISSTMGETLKAEGAEAAGVDPSKVKVEWWLECSGLRANDYDAPCARGETPARYLNVSIEDDYKPVFALGFAGATNGVYAITGKAGVRTQ